LIVPKEFNSIKTHWANKTMKDIVLFYQTFKFHFKLPYHINELYQPNMMPKMSAKARDQYIDDVVKGIINDID